MTDLASPAVTVDDTSTRLLQAAAEVFAQKGYDNAGVAEIARRAGVTTGAIYSRYTGKAELLAATLTQCLPDEFDSLFADHAFDGQVADVLRTVGSHLVLRPASPRHGLLLEAFVAARRDPELAAAIRSALLERRAQLGEMLDAAKELGVVDRSLDTTSMVHFAQAVGFGFLGYEALGIPHPDAVSWEALISKVISAVVAPATDAPITNPITNPITDLTPS